MKTKGISKYRTDWQILRTSLKDISNVGDKLRLVKSYYEQNKNYPTYERIVNWAQGLALGYKGRDPMSLRKVEGFLIDMGLDRPLVDKEPPEPPITSFSQEALRSTFKDLYARAEKWSKSNYFNEELLAYLESLESAITLSLKKTTKTLRDKRQQAQLLGIKSTHKFLF